MTRDRRARARSAAPARRRAAAAAAPAARPARRSRPSCPPGASPPDGVAVPGHAVPAVPVQAQPGGDERLAQLRLVVRVQRRRAPLPAPDPAAAAPRRKSTAAGGRRRSGRTSAVSPRATAHLWPAARTDPRPRSASPAARRPTRRGPVVCAISIARRTGLAAAPHARSSSDPWNEAVMLHYRDSFQIYVRSRSTLTVLLPLGDSATRSMRCAPWRRARAPGNTPPGK